jgi:antitoxin VapB
MPLYIRNEEVHALAIKLQRQTNAASKTEAVRIALVHELERNRAAAPPLRDRLARLQAEVAKIGLPNPEFDMKKFSDEMWDD